MRIPVANLPKVAGLMAILVVAAACASPGASGAGGERWPAGRPDGCGR